MQRYTDTSQWQELAGYSRAVRHGDRIAVSGTTASAPDGSPVFPGDTLGQTLDALTKGVEAVVALGGRAEDVVRTRIYLVPEASWRDAAEAHRQVFGHVAPANTLLYVAALVGDGLLVEAELEAEIGAGAAAEGESGSDRA